MQPASAEDRRDDDILLLLQTSALEPALELLLERYEAKVYRLCCSMLRDRTLAEDVAQESWVRIWKALSKFDHRASLSTWIYAITRNRCLTAIEQRRDRTSPSADDFELQVTASEPDTTDAEELSRLLKNLVQGLPERYQRALTLFYYEDRSVAEVAYMLNIPAGTVKTVLYRARAALGEQFKRRGLDDPKAW